MDAASSQRVRVQAQLLAVRAEVRQRDLRRLLHHVTELAGQGQTRLAVHRGGLDEEHVAAGSGDRESGRHAGYRRALRRLRGEPGPTQVLLEVGDRDTHLVRRLGQRHRHLAQDAGQSALQLTYPRLPGVFGGDQTDRLVGHGDLVGGEAGAVELPGQQVDIFYYSNTNRDRMVNRVKTILTFQ